MKDKYYFTHFEEETKAGKDWGPDMAMALWTGLLGLSKGEQKGQMESHDIRQNNSQSEEMTYIRGGKFPSIHQTVD